MTDVSLDNYYYGYQLRRYLTAFMAIFAGLKVATGKNDLGSTTNLISVPITWGDRDRVVDAILSNFTQNKPVRVPALSAWMNGIEIDESLMVGTGTTNKEVHLPLGEELPDGLLVVERYRPVPYRMRTELVVYASNTDQQVQMLEQILSLFKPNLQIQISDALMDWAKITTVTLENIGLDETYPSGTAKRVITTTLNFSTVIRLSAPYNLTKNYIENINVRIAAIPPSQSFFEYFREVQGSDTPYDETIEASQLDIPPS